jgi:hypothetical protein
LGAGKCKSISLSRGSKLVMFQYVIGDSDLERVGVLVDNRMTFVNHNESIVSKLARMLGFIKRICGFCPVRFGVCIVRVVASSRGSFGED